MNGVKIAKIVGYSFYFIIWVSLLVFISIFTSPGNFVLFFMVTASIPILLILIFLLKNKNVFDYIFFLYPFIIIILALLLGSIFSSFMDPSSIVIEEERICKLESIDAICDYEENIMIQNYILVDGIFDDCKRPKRCFVLKESN